MIRSTATVQEITEQSKRAIITKAPIGLHNIIKVFDSFFFIGFYQNMVASDMHLGIKSLFICLKFGTVIAESILVGRLSQGFQL